MTLFTMLKGTYRSKHALIESHRELRAFRWPSHPFIRLLISESDVGKPVNLFGAAGAPSKNPRAMSVHTNWHPHPYTGSNAEILVG